MSLLSTGSLAEPRPSRTAKARPAAIAKRKGAVVLADVGAVTVALVAAFLAVHPSSDRSVHAHLLVSVVALPVWILALSHFRLYASQSLYRRPEELGRIVHAAAAVSLTCVSCAFMFRLPVEREWPAVVFASGILALLAEREVVRRVFRSMRRTGRLLRSVVVVGANVEAVALVHMLSQDRALGYRVVAVVDDLEPPGSTFAGVPVFGVVSDTLNVAKTLGAGGVVIAATAVDMATSNRLARELTDAGVHVEISSSLLDIAPERLCVQPLGRFPVVYVRPVHFDGWRALMKRVFDTTVSIIGLVLALPVLVGIAVAIKLDSPGPVLFRQERVGRGGRLFSLLKFRSMVVDAEQRLDEVINLNEADGPMFKIREDPRVTRVGRLIRRLSLDELPQLLNVVRGDMSLVGPRPALEREIAQWRPELHQRLRVKPGITGMWQVSGRSDLSFADYARLDLYYVDNWSLWTDVAILAKTLPTVLLRRGGY